MFSDDLREFILFFCVFFKPNQLDCLLLECMLHLSDLLAINPNETKFCVKRG